MNITEQLLEFHEVMAVPVLAEPTVPTDDRVRLRCRLIAEECIEFLEACYPYAHDTIKALRAEIAYLTNPDVYHAIRVSLPEAADALADIAYVVEGTNLEFGIDGAAVLSEVHRANMAKADGPVREDGKRLKPPNWVGPDIAAVLARQRLKSERGIT
jgi:predicted HAD superfamily Cof-like phosphohydrolase